MGDDLVKARILVVYAIDQQRGHSVGDIIEVEAYGDTFYDKNDYIWEFNQLEILSDEDDIEPATALEVQEGGSHYKDMEIQPMEYCFKNKLSYPVSNVIKYVSRYQRKNGIEDLKKAKHCIDLLIELEYGE